MSSNKGFTLVELIATVTIMLLITVIAIPVSMNFIEKGKQKQYDILEDQIISAADKYYINHKDTTCIEIEKLLNDIDDKFINENEVKNPKDNSTIKSVDVITENNRIKFSIKNNECIQ